MNSSTKKAFKEITTIHIRVWRRKQNTVVSANQADLVKPLKEVSAPAQDVERKIREDVIESGILS